MGYVQNPFPVLGKKSVFLASGCNNVRLLPVAQEVAGWNPFASAATVSGFSVIRPETYPYDAQLDYFRIADNSAQRPPLGHLNCSRGYAVLMFWLSRSRLFGSYFFLISARRA